jgi:cell wall-associated NlpC family hydrolase
VIRHAALTALLIAATAMPAATAAGIDYTFTCNHASLTADFTQRDGLPHSETPPADWYLQRDGRYLNGGWGPAAAALPPVAVPPDAGCDATTWKRERILSAALHYVNSSDNPQGLQYRHHHIPDWDPQTSTATAAAERSDEQDGESPETWGAGRGLDCSNFTAWVYNFGLGIKFGGSVGKQYAGTAGPMGQRISADGPFQLGDLLYLHPDGDATKASHVVIFVDDNHIIDSRLNAQGVAGIQVRAREGWYRIAVLGGWRPISG